MLWSAQLSSHRQKPFTVWWDHRLMTTDCIMMIVMITVSHILSRVITDLWLFRCCWSHSEVQTIHKEVTTPGLWPCAPLQEARPGIPLSCEVRGCRQSGDLQLLDVKLVSAAGPGEVHCVWPGARGPALRDRQAGAAGGEPRGPRVKAGEAAPGQHGQLRGHVRGPGQHLAEGEFYSKSPS